MTVIIGVDPHKASHTAVAISDGEEELDRRKVRSGGAQLSQLVSTCCGSLSWQSIILTYGVATRNAGYYPAGLAILIYLRNLWLRRGESWRPIPTARELARRGCRCTTCCIHGTPTQHEVSRRVEIH